jgi:hypothetical protein
MNPVPIALLGRLAIDRGWARQGARCGAVLRVVSAAGTIGERSVRARDFPDEIKAFLRTVGSRVSQPTNRMTLMITIEQAERMLGRPR